VLSRVLPDRAGVWLTAASRLYPEPEAGARRRPLLERARELAEGRPAEGAEDHCTRARIYAALGRPDDALGAYQSALNLQPGQDSWRVEFARLLRERGRLREAREELLTVLAAQPGHGEARTLLEAVAQELAEKM
jgi:hypothetical protein